MNPINAKSVQLIELHAFACDLVCLYLSESLDIFENRDIHVNHEFLYQRFGDNQESREAYLSSFMRMSRKGFVSLDRTNVTEKTDQTYHVVCYPKHTIELNFWDLPHADGQILDNHLVNIHLLNFFK